jgi:putative ABC transport system permease protein
MDFAKTVMLAALIAIPVAYFAMDQWLAQYFLRISLNAWVFFFAVFVVVFLALVTVSFQTINTARANPTDSLRQD